VKETWIYETATDIVTTKWCTFGLSLLSSPFKAPVRMPGNYTIVKKKCAKLGICQSLYLFIVLVIV
jgi:hypothetical protein